MVKNLKKWIGKNYTISSYYHHRRLRREERKPGSPIIVYQMGKVGSTAIVSALHERLPNSPIFHVHFLTESGVTDAKSRLRRLMRRFNANTWCLYESDFVREYLSRRDRSQRTQIITLVREPIARTISSFFYNIQKYVPEIRYSNVEEKSDISELCNKYLDLFTEHEYSLNWFDRELMPTFGIDVFDYEFNQEKGYSIISKDGLDLLVLKLERLEGCASAAFQEFLNIGNLSLDRANTADEQPYYMLYKKFLNEVQLPGLYVDKMYESKYMKHFYSAMEISRFRSRWERVSDGLNR